MGRPKGFTREEVLLKAIALFWEKGLSDTTLKDIEQATGVNKSGLYAEFRNKEDIFLESLRYYLGTRGGDDILSTEPKGWNNVRRFLEIGHTCYSGQRGCFSVNSLRDASRLPPEALKIVDENNRKLHRLLDLPPVSAYPSLRNIARRRSCDKVGNAGSVFQVGEAHVLGIAQLFVDGRELTWRSIAQAAVWPLFVVLRLPV